MVAALSAGLVLAGGGPAVADALSKGGPEIKFVTQPNFDGFLYGARSMRFPFPEQLPGLYVGAMAYGTLPLFGASLAPAYGYAGGLVGWEGRLPGAVSWLSYDLDLHAGLARNLGDASVPFDKSLVTIEPSVSLGVPVPFFKATRLSAAVGYVVLPFALASNMISLSLRWESKTLTRPAEE
jgi:hypothetical protein